MASRVHVAVHLILMLIIAGLVFLLRDTGRAGELRIEALVAQVEQSERRARAALAEVEAARHELRFAREDERQARRELAALRRLEAPQATSPGAGPGSEATASGPVLPHPDDPIFARLNPAYNQASSAAEHPRATEESDAIAMHNPATETARPVVPPIAMATRPGAHADTDASPGPPTSPATASPHAAPEIEQLLAQAEKEVRERFRDQPELLARMLELLRQTREANRAD